MRPHPPTWRPKTQLKIDEEQFMLGQAMQPHFAIAPAILLMVIGLAMLLAVTIVVVSLIKAGKGAGVVVVFITLTLCGLFLAGLMVPMYKLRSVASHQQMQAQMEAEAAHQQMELRHWEIAPPIQVHPELAPPQVAPPAQVVPPYEERNPEVISDEEMSVTADAASPSDESSASKDEVLEKSLQSWSESEPSPASPSPEPAAADRPAWVGQPLGTTKNGVQYVYLKIGPYHSHDEIQKELYAQLKVETDRYMEEFIAPNAPYLVTLPPGYTVDHGILAERWDELLPAEQFSFGEKMHTLHVQLQFDEKVRKDLSARYEQAVVKHRLGAFGLGGGLLLALLGTLYGYLKLDTVTKGYYSGRLRLAAVLAGLSAAGAAAGLVAKQMVMWV